MGIVFKRAKAIVSISALFVLVWFLNCCGLHMVTDIISDAVHRKNVKKGLK